jgi:hypothetical protein
MPTSLPPRAFLLSSLALSLAALAAGCAASSGKPYTAIAADRTAAPPYPYVAPSSAEVAQPAYGGADVAVAPDSTVVLAGPTPAPAPDERPGLATAWGESVWSPITMQPFVRASSAPWAATVIHYNDAEGVRAHAAYLGAAVAPLETWVGDGAVGVSIVDDGGAMLPGLAAAGRNLIAAVDGQRYQIVIRNTTSARFEVIASVDGLDVIDGKPAGIDRRGYLVDPQGELVIDGFRQSDDQVAAFRFGKVASSYAAATSGDANVGVIGIALFAERGATWTRAELQRRDQANPFPARGYATAP